MWELSTHAAADLEFNLYFRISLLQDSSMQTRGERERRRELLQHAHETSYNANLTLPWSENLQYHAPYIFLKDQRHISNYFSAFKK